MSGRLGTVVIGGGSGFIGTALTSVLKRKGYNTVIVSRMPGPQRISWTELASSGLPKGCSAVINLAGQNILDPTRRWTPGFKQNVWSSRVNTTKALSTAICNADCKPSVFVTVSGVGYYKPSLTDEYTEDSPGGNFDFLSKLCTEWEAAAKLAGDDVRRVTIRSGIVLGRNGGMIQQLYLPFWMGLGGPIGNGLQPLPWIHISDMARLFMFALEGKDGKMPCGVYNGVAPGCVTNAEFTKAFASAIRRPAFIPVPHFALNIAFGEERAKIMTEGQRVKPCKALEDGFVFLYPEIDSACKAVVGTSKHSEDPL
ncbi:epimerase family protein SDR39U1 [Ischnura elegans]|uniref:epimerase family protein SDR39U1 n=1 Tax=Ischnura elegans TaxID=197161 RepID=UPI001ED8A3E6|nr:epimerase family protein SDR39U1 [Ischnura elegans]